MEEICTRNFDDEALLAEGFKLYRSKFTLLKTEIYDFCERVSNSIGVNLHYATEIKAGIIKMFQTPSE